MIRGRLIRFLARQTKRRFGHDLKRWSPALREGRPTNGFLFRVKYLKQIAEQVYRTQTSASGNVRLDSDLRPVLVGIDQAIPCGLVVNEMLTNSFKHGFDAQGCGEVRLELREKENESVWLQESDSAVGLPADFEGRRERSLGVQLISDLSRQLGGRLEIGSGQGARFVLPSRKPVTGRSVTRFTPRAK